MNVNKIHPTPVSRLVDRFHAAELAAPKMWPLRPRDADLLLERGRDEARRARFAEQYAEKREQIRVAAGVDLTAGIADDDLWREGEFDLPEGGLLDRSWR